MNYDETAPICLNCISDEIISERIEKEGENFYN